MDDALQQFRTINGILSPSEELPFVSTDRTSDFVEFMDSGGVITDLNVHVGRNGNLYSIALQNKDKTTEGSTCNLGLSQLNVFRRQAKEGVVYTMNLPQNASRDMRVFQLLPHGRPWPCVTNIIEGHIDDNTDKENWQAIKWLCKALDTALDRELQRRLCVQRIKLGMSAT